MNEKDNYKVALLVLLNYPGMERLIGKGLFRMTCDIINEWKNKPKHKPFTVIEGRKKK